MMMMMMMMMDQFILSKNNYHAAETATEWCYAKLVILFFSSLLPILILKRHM